MPTLLLEIGCEELPAAACREAAAQLPELCHRYIGADPAALFVGPRRLALLVKDVPERTPDEERRGPAERIAFDERGQPTKAAEGFARGAGVAVEELERRDGHVWARIPGERLVDTLPQRLRQIPRGLAFSKSMVWEPDGMRFARPVRWLSAKLDAEPVGDLAGVSFGHRFSAGQLEIPQAEAYADVLRRAGVEPDARERRRQIVDALDAIGGWNDPGAVLEEVIYLVESPVVLEGRFDERYLELPERVVVAAMQAHQRYFPLGGARFAFVANGGDAGVVTAGNERVLESRLEDAAFTFERDVKQGIENLAARLGSITFVEGAGSFADKTARLRRLVEALGGGEVSLEAARLAKADQAAELVREFPDLEGYIGAEYARLAGYPEPVAAAVEEHYLPDAAGGPLPRTEAGRVLAAAEKIDNLTVGFVLGQRPTGSRDPYGLRRAAIGLCRLAFEATVPIDVHELSAIAFRELSSQGYAGTLEPPGDLVDFVSERLEGLLDCPVEFVRAARAAALHDLGGVGRLALALAALDDEQLGVLHTAYTRADRLAGRSEPDAAPSLREELLLEPAEIEVARTLQEVEPRIEAGLAELDVEAAISAATELGAPLDRFFDEVLVMADDRSVRANRLRLLLDVRDAVGLLGDFGQIPR